MRSRETLNSRPDEDSGNEHTLSLTHTHTYIYIYIYIYIHVHTDIHTSTQTAHLLFDFDSFTHLLTHALLSKQRLNPG